MAFRHAAPSARGFLRMVVRQPVFALKLLFQRVVFFLTRRVVQLVDPRGYPLDTPADVVQYWSFMVERCLDAPEWLSELQRDEHPFVIDVGANVGIFAYRAIVANPGAHILAVEPQERALKRLTLLAQRTGARLEPVRAACSDEPGRGMLHVLNDLDTTASLRSTWNPHALQEERKALQVDVVTLDELASGRSPLLVKIDAEGHDTAVIAGGRATLARTRFVIAECADSDAVRAVADALGAPWRMARRLGDIDCLFERPTLSVTTR